MIKFISTVCFLFNCVALLLAQQGQGMYFRKKHYQKHPLPEFEDTRDKLPHPIFDEDSSYVACYWKAWEIAFQTCMNRPGKRLCFSV